MEKSSLLSSIKRRKTVTSLYKTVTSLYKTVTSLYKTVTSLYKKFPNHITGLGQNRLNIEYRILNKIK
jgi:ribosomal protein S18